MNSVVPSGDCDLSEGASRRSFLVSSGLAVLTAPLSAGVHSSAGPAPTAPPQELCAAAFDSLIGQSFVLEHPDRSRCTLRLLRVERHAAAGSGSALSGFDLIFDGRPGLPPGDALVRVSHPSLGSLPIFLQHAAPPGRAGTRYVAVFNHLAGSPAVQSPS